MKHFNIDEMDLPYLAVQCGDIAHLLPHRTEWLIAYNARIENVFKSMKPSLPKTCKHILDVGGGFSGIGAKLVEHYGKSSLTVLDGIAAPPEVVRHNEPFSDAAVAADFLLRNGVEFPHFVAPTDELPNKEFDLVISTQAWGFHIAPHVYLPMISRALARPAKLILDVRNRHPDWLADLRNAFGIGVAIYGAEKWTRWCFDVE